MTARRLVAVLLAASLLLFPSTSANGQSTADGARAFLVQRHGGRAADWNLVVDARASLDGTQETAWAGKFFDETRGLGGVAYQFADGSYGDSAEFERRSQAALAKLASLDRKADEALLAAFARASDGDKLPVAVWLAADAGSAVSAVIAKHPEVAWIGERFDVDDLAAGRAIRAELDVARQQAYASAQAAFAPIAEARGGVVEYSSLFAPLVFVSLPKDAVVPIAELPSVRSIGLDGDAWRPSLAYAGPTVQANWTSTAADQGTGVRVGVIEYYNVKTTGDLNGQVVASRSTAPGGAPVLTPTGTFDHATWVAGAIASLDSVSKGVAPGADIVSSSTAGGSAGLTRDQNVIRAADWAQLSTGGDADVLNVSLVQDTVNGRDQARAYFDSIAGGESFRTVVAASGNYGLGVDGTWIIGAPGNGWNTLTVGGTNDGSTAAWGNDVLWFNENPNSGAQWEELQGAPYNTHNDFNKPNVSAPAVSVVTANGLSASGTSVATPITSGVVAQVLANSPTLLAWPEVMRALIMSSALHHTPMPGGGVNRDHEGTGTVSARWANIVDVEGGAGNGGYKRGNLTAGALPLTQAFSAVAGDKVRVAFAWNSDTSGGLFTKVDTLRADLDLRVYRPGGTIVGTSATFDNAYEFVEFTAPVTGTYTINIQAARFDGASEYYGLVWTKWLPGTE
jgi:hypothetical protein